jgi:hypothetical protein
MEKWRADPTRSRVQRSGVITAPAKADFYRDSLTSFSIILKS